MVKTIEIGYINLNKVGQNGTAVRLVVILLMGGEHYHEVSNYNSEQST